MIEANSVVSRCWTAIVCILLLLPCGVSIAILSLLLPVWHSVPRIDVDYITLPASGCVVADVNAANKIKHFPSR